MVSKQDYSESEDEWQDEEVLEEMEIEREDEGEEGQPMKKQKLEDKQPRISKQEQREILEKRRAHKPNAPLVVQCKKLWETIRVKKVDKEKRIAAMEELMTLVKGKCVEHDASRIIQCCLKYGNDDQRNIIAEELKGHFVEVSKSQYGKFIIGKILKFCRKYRSLVVTSFYGKVRKLIKNKDASVVIEECYSQYANATQRTALMQEFYGPEFSVFKSDEPKTLGQLLTEQPVKAPSILKHLQQIIFSLLEKEQSNLQSQTIIHRAILDYFKAIKTINLEPKGLSEGTESKANVNPAITELVELLKDHLVHILHTREGSQVAQLTVLHATPKQRKAIIKSCKTFVTKIACEQYGSAVLMSVFECLDDTVLVSKSLLSELFAESSLTDLLRDSYGVKVIMFLLSGRNRKAIAGSVIDELTEMDADRSLTCKKSDETKRAELRAYTLDNLAPAICASKDFDVLVRCKVANVVLLELVRLGALGLLDCIFSLVGGRATDSAEGQKSFNAVQNMRDATVKAKLKESGIEIDEPVLSNRNSSLFLKKMILCSNDAAEGIFKAIMPTLMSVIQACSESPNTTLGAGYIMLALCEKSQDMLNKVKAAIKENQETFAECEKKVSLWRKGADKEIKETAIEKLMTILKK